MDASASSAQASSPLSHGILHIDRPNQSSAAVNPSLHKLQPQLQPQLSVFLPRHPSSAASPCMSSSDHANRHVTAAGAASGESELTKAAQFGCGVAAIAAQVAPLAPSVKLESNPTPAVALSAQAAMGAGAAKVSKRRTKKSSKTPITVLSADTTNFRAMVQKLTGIPSSPCMQQQNEYQLGGIRMPVSKAPRETVPTLDSSSYLLSRGTSAVLPCDTLFQNSLGLPFLQSSQLHSDPSFAGSKRAAEIGSNDGRGNVNQSSFITGANSDCKFLVANVPVNLSNVGSSCTTLQGFLGSAEGGLLRR